MNRYRVTRVDGTSEMVDESGTWDACNALHSRDTDKPWGDMAALVSQTPGIVELVYLSDKLRYRAEFVEHVAASVS